MKKKTKTTRNETENLSLNRSNRTAERKWNKGAREMSQKTAPSIFTEEKMQWEMNRTEYNTTHTHSETHNMRKKYVIAKLSSPPFFRFRM